MALFVALHRHTPTDCVVAGKPSVQLSTYISAAVAARYGVAILADAVLEGQHNLVLVVEAANRACVESFMGFFTRWGEVQIFSASSVDEAVTSGGCATHSQRIQAGIHMTEQIHVTPMWEEER